MLSHIALTINDSEEIENFYEEVLLFSILQKFSVNEEISQKIFQSEGISDVYMMEHQSLRLEIFISPKKEKKVFSHICLAYWKAAIIYEKAVASGYKAVIKKTRTTTPFLFGIKAEICLK